VQQDMQQSNAALHSTVSAEGAPVLLNDALAGGELSRQAGKGAQHRKPAVDDLCAAVRKKFSTSCLHFMLPRMLLNWAAGPTRMSWHRRRKWSTAMRHTSGAAPLKRKASGKLTGRPVRLRSSYIVKCCYILG
jgi:transketolase